MLRKIALLVALAAAALTAAIATPAALADCVSDASVTYVGSDWGPVPMWRVSVPSLNATWDVQAADGDAARAIAAPYITCPAAAPAPAADPAPVVPPVIDPAPVQTPGAPSDLAVGQATQIVTEATVTYVGNSWGPLPIWRVNVPSRNATYDVAAATADAARQAVLGTVASDIDRNPVVAPAAVSASKAPALAGASNGAPVQVDLTIDTTPIAKPAGVVVKTPAKAKTAKKGVHITPATSKTKR